MRVSYSKKVHPSTGEKIEIVNLIDVLKTIPNISKTHGKNQDGGIWTYCSDKVGVDFGVISEGVLFVDIDKINKEQCKKIFDCFDLLQLEMQGVVACWFSHSYYNPEKQYGGLHFVINANEKLLVHRDDKRIDNLNYFSYREQNTIYSALLAAKIFKLTGIDIRPYHNNELGTDCGLDKAMKSIGQRLYLNYSEIHINEFAGSSLISPELIKQLQIWFDEDRPNKLNWFDIEYKEELAEFKYKPVKRDEIQVIDGKKINLGYSGRITIGNFLASLNWSEEEIIDFLWNICGQEDFAGGEIALKKSIEQTVKTGIRKYSNDRLPGYLCEKAAYLLEKIGVKFQKQYIPGDALVNSEFEKIWNEYNETGSLNYNEPENYNVHYNNRRYYKFNLKQNEYLSTVKNDLYDIISSYPVTCIFADCAVGKTHMSLDFKMDPQLDIFMDQFGIKDTSGVDICEPFNSVADSKVEGAIDRKDIERVRTSDVKRYSFNKKNVFIWDSLETIYNVHFNGLQKREVLFFDEAHKIITDKYRWATILKMMPLIKKMYKHVVFMTGTSVYEWKFFEQFWNKEDIAMVLVNKDRIHKLTGDVLVYKKFGDGDRRFLLETLLAENKLVQIYSNAENKSWRNIINKINTERKEYGLKEYKVLDYRRDNRDRLLNVNETGNIDNYDIVLGTAYLGVGVDFLPSEKDNRSRYVIIDLPGETNCTAQELWQFANRNRNQPFHLIIPVLEKSLKEKLYGSTLTIQQLTKIAKAKVGLNNIPNPEDTELTDTEALAHITNVIIQHSEFPEIVKFKKNNLYNQDVIVDLVTHYLGYVGRFCNTNMIIHYLKRRGVTVNIVNKEHITEGIDNTDINTNFKWFVNNMEECITAEFHKDKYQYIYKYTDINNTMETNRIENGIIYATNPNYIRQLNKLVINDPSWRPVLKETAEKNEVMSMNFINAVQSIRYIVNNISKQELNKLKKLYEIGGNEVIESQVNEILKLLFGDIFTDSNKDQYELNKLKEKYTNILIFITTIYNEIKNLVEHKEKNTLTAAIQIAAQLDIKNKTDKRKKMSEKKTKHIEVKNTKNGKVIKNVTTYEQLAKYLNVSFETIKNIIKDEKLQKKYNVKVTVLD